MHSAGFMVKSVNSETHASSLKVEKEALSTYYDSKWYLGCVISYDNILKVWKIKFLRETHTGFKRPTSDDIQTVDKKFIL